MDGTLVKSGERYLFRFKGKQVPVVIEKRAAAKVARMFWRSGWVYNMTRVDTGEVIIRRTASALSKHYDDCVLLRLSQCGCAARLAKEGRQ